MRGDQGDGLWPAAAGAEFIASWVRSARPLSLRRGKRGRTARAIEAEVVRLSLANLMTFPWIAEAAAAGRLDLAGPPVRRPYRRAGEGRVRRLEPVD